MKDRTKVHYAMICDLWRIMKSGEGMWQDEDARWKHLIRAGKEFRMKYSGEYMELSSTLLNAVLHELERCSKEK